MARKRSLETLLKALRQQLSLFAERYGVETLGVFGSYVRTEQKTDSDLDILVTFRETPSLLVGVGLLIHQKKKQQRLKFHQAQISLAGGKTVDYNSPR